MGGKKGGSKIEVNEYRMSLHLGVCNALDSFKRIIVGEKVAWEGNVTANDVVAINQQQLFGGPKKEGGLTGLVYFLLGSASQVLPDILAARLGRGTGANCPGFRGLGTLFFTGGENTGGGFTWAANNPYLKDIAVEGLRAPVGLDPAFALIPRGGGNVDQEVIDTFTGLSWTLPCTTSVSSTICFCSAGSNDSLALDGDPAVTYYATFRLRGVIEFVTYTGGTSVQDHVVLDATGQTQAGPNTYKLDISDPPATYFLNNGTFTSDGLNAVDYTLSLPIQGGATVTLTALSNDGAQVKNSTTISATDNDDARPIVVTQPYAGQFLQMDALSIIGAGADVAMDANPVHMIYECLTNRDWGMGASSSLIDFDVFEEAAVTVFNEGLGLSMLWTRQDTIENFVGEILNHIQATVFVNPRTGLLTIKLIRDDYDVETLRTIDPDNAKLSNFQRKSWGEVTNEIVVTWTNPESEQDETVTVHDLAAIAAQGGIVSGGRNFYGVRSASLAMTLAHRELRSAAAPLASCDVELDRTAWDLLPGDVVTLDWPERGISGMVMRVGPVDYGRPGEPVIKASLVEDVFGFAQAEFVTPPGSSWESEDTDPEPVEHARMITVPLFLAANYTDLNDAQYPEVMAGVLASTTDGLNYDLWGPTAQPDGSSVDQVQSTNTLLGHGTLVAELDAEATSTSVTFDGLIGRVAPAVNVFVAIGDDSDGEEVMEVAMITAVAGSSYTLLRGLLDTVPRAWSAGTTIWLLDIDSDISDLHPKSDGETVAYKLLTRTFGGVLDEADAGTVSGDMIARPWLPNRPANVEAYGEAWSSQEAVIDAVARSDPWVTVTWANRNRLLEDSQVLAWTDATMSPEDGQTTRIEVLAFDGTAITTHGGLTGSTFDVPDPSFGTETIVRLRVYADRTDGDGDFTSLQFFEHWVQVAPLTADTTRVTADTTHWTADEG